MLHPPRVLSWEKQVLFVTVQVTYVLAFLSMLRASNLLPASLTVVDSRRLMVWGRLTDHEGGVVCTVILAKTIQFGEREHQISLAARPGSIFCPMAALRRVYELRQGHMIGPNDPVLQIPVGGQWRPICKDTVVSVMRMQMAKMKIDPMEYSFHSFRHGAIQTAVLAQPSLELVRLQSGHMSDAVHLYTQMPGAARMVTTAKMLEAMDRVAVLL
jgi:integrase